MFQDADRLSGSANNARWDSHNCPTIRHRMDHHRSGPDLYVIPQPNVTEDRGSRPNHHPITDRRMPLATYISGAAKRYALVKKDVITDFRSFANHHACSVIDKHAFADFRPGMNLDACQEACTL